MPTWLPHRARRGASGMLASHYAPRCEVRLVDTADDALALAAGTRGARILDLTDDIARYARELYAALRQADADGVRTLIAVLPSPDGLGHAIRDRLEKAAAPRPRNPSGVPSWSIPSSSSPSSNVPTGRPDRETRSRDSTNRAH